MYSILVHRSSTSTTSCWMSFSCENQCRHVRAAIAMQFNAVIRSVLGQGFGDGPNDLMNAHRAAM